jgi:catechol 2,3-dioxygenase-like lactoylglutathione lyase family enzyme
VETAIAGLLNQYDRGAITRRTLIRRLVSLAGLATTTATAAQNLQMSFDWAPLVDHVQISSENVRSSTEFYRNVLGLNLLRVGPPDDRNCCPDESAFLGVGSRLILAIRKKSPGRELDHYALLMNNFDRDRVTRELLSRGAQTKQTPATGFYIEDPDGIKVQLMGQPGPA